jgi:hypothetical protein
MRCYIYTFFTLFRGATRRADCITFSPLIYIEQIYAEMSSLMTRQLTNAWVETFTVAYLMQFYLANKYNLRIFCEQPHLKEEEPACDETTA